MSSLFTILGYLGTAFKYRAQIKEFINLGIDLAKKFKVDHPSTTSPSTSDALGAIIGSMKIKPPSEWTREEYERHWNRGLENTP